MRLDGWFSIIIAGIRWPTGFPVYAGIDGDGALVLICRLWVNRVDYAQDRGRRRRFGQHSLYGLEHLVWPGRGPSVAMQYSPLRGMSWQWWTRHIELVRGLGVDVVTSANPIQF